jgi:hypothetical protein
LPSQRAADDARLQVWVEANGPFFEKDVKRTLYSNIGEMLDKVAAFMEHDVKEQVAGHEGDMPYWTGTSLAHIEGYRVSKRTGKHWSLWAAVGSVTAGMSRKHAIRTKAAAASIEARWHPYRRTKGNIYRSRAVISADLTKGLD